MTEEKKKGFLAKIFGTKKSSCCNLRIEEVTEDEKKEADKKGTTNKSQTQSNPSCCGNQPK